MWTSARLIGWMLTANVAGFGAVVLLGADPAGAARHVLLWCGLR